MQRLVIDLAGFIEAMQLLALGTQADQSGLGSDVTRQHAGTWRSVRTHRLDTLLIFGSNRLQDVAARR